MASCSQLLDQLRVRAQSTPNLQRILAVFDQFGTGIAVSISVRLPSDDLGFVGAEIVTSATLNGKNVIIIANEFSTEAAPFPSIIVIAGDEVLAEEPQFFPVADDIIPGEMPSEPPSFDPILLDFGGLGFDLTAARDGVRFDFDADGTPEQVAWTRRGSRDAFLVLDRNGNGVVDHGGELFGDMTRLADGSLAPNGYVALAELDLPSQGGNRNGYLDRADRAYRALRLWMDGNHDGVSDPVELTTLESRGVVAIRTTARMSPAADAHGNLFALVSVAHLRGRIGVRSILTTDVLFVVEGAAR